MEVAVPLVFDSLIPVPDPGSRLQLYCNLWPRFFHKSEKPGYFLHKIAVVLSTSRTWTKDVDMFKKRPVKKHRWYLGGFASAGAAVFTHPLDLMKVRHAFLRMFSSIVYVAILCLKSLNNGAVSLHWPTNLPCWSFVERDWSVQVAMNVFAAISSTPAPRHSISSWPLTNNDLPMFIDKGAFFERFVA